MSIFGKFGVGGSIPGKFSQGPDESAEPIATINVGTCSNTPDTAPAKTVPELKHN